MKNVLTFISDLIFIGFITFLLSFIILSHYFAPIVAIILSALLTVAGLVFIARRMKIKKNKEYLNRAQKLACLKLSEALSTTTHSDQLKLLSQALEKNQTEHALNKRYIKIKDKKIALVMAFSFNPITKADLVSFFNYNDPDYKTYILADTFTDEIKDFAKRFNNKLILIEKEKVYEFFTRHQITLNEKLLPINQKIKLKTAITNLLDRRKSKSFFLFGIIFLFTSYFVPIKIYYVVFGCVFLIISLALKLFGKDQVRV